MKDQNNISKPTEKTLPDIEKATIEGKKKREKRKEIALVICGTTLGGWIGYELSGNAGNEIVKVLGLTGSEIMGMYSGGGVGLLSSFILTLFDWKRGSENYKK